MRFSFGCCPGAMLRERDLDAPQAELLLATMHELVSDDPLEQLVLVNQATSFTLIRVLVTLYNALAFSKQLPLYELAAPVAWPELAPALHTRQPLLQPRYSANPNITYAHQPRK